MSIEVQLLRTVNCLPPTVNIELGINLLDVPFHRGGRHDQPLCDLGIGKPFDHKANDIQFTLGQWFSQRLCRRTLQVGQRSPERCCETKRVRVTLSRVFGGCRLEYFVQGGR